MYSSVNLFTSRIDSLRIRTEVSMPRRPPQPSLSNTITSYTHPRLISLRTHFSRSSTLGQWIPTVGSLLCPAALSNTVGGATCTEPESCHTGVFHAACQQRLLQSGSDGGVSLCGQSENSSLTSEMGCEGRTFQIRSWLDNSSSLSPEFPGPRLVARIQVPLLILFLCAQNQLLHYCFLRCVDTFSRINLSVPGREVP